MTSWQKQPFKHSGNQLKAYKNPTISYTWIKHFTFGNKSGNLWYFCLELLICHSLSWWGRIKNCSCTIMVHGSLDVERCIMPLSSDTVGRIDLLGEVESVGRANSSANLRLWKHIPIWDCAHVQQTVETWEGSSQPHTVNSVAVHRGDIQKLNVKEKLWQT